MSYKITEHHTTSIVRDPHKKLEINYLESECKSRNSGISTLKYYLQCANVEIKRTRLSQTWKYVHSIESSCLRTSFHFPDIGMEPLARFYCPLHLAVFNPIGVICNQIITDWVDRTMQILKFVLASAIHLKTYHNLFFSLQCRAVINMLKALF